MTVGELEVMSGGAWSVLIFFFFFFVLLGDVIGSDQNHVRIRYRCLLFFFSSFFFCQKDPVAVSGEL